MRTYNRYLEHSFMIKNIIIKIQTIIVVCSIKKNWYIYYGVEWTCLKINIQLNNTVDIRNSYVVTNINLNRHSII